jgi:molybdate transport system substrate-binding protein
MAIKVISSMATRQLLIELVQAYKRFRTDRVLLESVGGVDAVKRIQKGEYFDVIILASDTFDQLIASGHVVPGSKVDFVSSTIAVAIREGTPQPDISTEEKLKEAMMAARSIGVSTGPSGTALLRIFEGWGLAGKMKERIIQPAPGTPVGALVAAGKVELGFQQLSELIHQQGITILGDLPPALQIVTTFSGALGAGGMHRQEAIEFLQYLCSADTIPEKFRQGMLPA